MTVQEINKNIHYNEKLVDEYSAEKRKLEAQIAELECLLNKYVALRTKFLDKQQQRERKIIIPIKSLTRNQIFEKYRSGMKELLRGDEFQRTYEGLSESIHRIKRKIMELDHMLDECLRNIAYRRERTLYWRSQLVLAMKKEV